MCTIFSLNGRVVWRNVGGYLREASGFAAAARRVNPEHWTLAGWTQVLAGWPLVWVKGRAENRAALESSLKGDSINFAWLVSSGMGWWVCLFLLSEILRWALNQHPHNKRTDGAAWQEKAISFWVSVVLYARQLSLFCSGSALILRLLNDNHHSPLYHHHHHHHHHHDHYHHHHDQHQLVVTSPLFPLSSLP